MLTIKSQGLTLAQIRTSPITEIMGLFIKYQSANEDACNGMPRVLALGSDIHAVLEGTEYDYNIAFINRHYALSVIRTDEYNGTRLIDYIDNRHTLVDTLHPLEIIRITETEEGR